MRVHDNLGRFDFDFRPDSYFSFKDWRHEIVSQIKGAARQKVFESLICKKGIETYEEFINAAIDGEIPPIYYRGLSDFERDVFGKGHPVLMGGEYLPDLDSKEVEAVRVLLKSVTADVISIRAKLDNGLIHYSVIDEYETQFLFEPRTSESPLSMGQMIDLIDSVDHALENFPETGLSRIYRGWDLREWDTVADALEFVTISSDFYPQLQSYYQQDAKLWLQQLRTGSV